jgi:hypothetical protein
LAAVKVFPGVTTLPELEKVRGSGSAQDSPVGVVPDDSVAESEKLPAEPLTPSTHKKYVPATRLEAVSETVDPAALPSWQATSGMFEQLLFGPCSTRWPLHPDGVRLAVNV